MSCTKQVCGRAFTLIELLVVIAIIGLLLAIIVPSLAKAKMYAQRSMCANNLKQLSLGTRLYADQNKSLVPTGLNSAGTGSPGAWFWDISFKTTSDIANYAGLDSKVFFCPANIKKKPTDARFWQFSWICFSNPTAWPISSPDLKNESSIQEESSLTNDQMKNGYRILSYIFMFDKFKYDPAKNTFISTLPTTLRTGESAKWVRKISDLRNSSATPMVMDVLIDSGMGNNFDNITSGIVGTQFGFPDSSNHFDRQSFNGTSNKKPWGINISYVDGHVNWQRFSDTNLRLKAGDAVPGGSPIGMDFWW